MLVLSPPVGPLTFNGAISQLQYDCAGRLLASVQGAGLFAIDAVTGAATQLALLPVINAMAVDEVTGDVLCTSGVLGSAQMLRITPPQVVVAGMAANDSASGLAVRTRRCEEPAGCLSLTCKAQRCVPSACARPSICFASARVRRPRGPYRPAPASTARRCAAGPTPPDRANSWSGC